MAPQPIRTPDPASAVTAKSETKNPNASTGPKTSEGKARSSQNSFKHGLASGALLVPEESPEEWESFLQDMRTEWSPNSPTEDLLVGDMAKHHWLKDRAVRMQNELLQTGNPFADMANTPVFPILMRYQVTNERAYARARKQLLETQKARKEFVSQNVPEPAPPPTKVAPPQSQKPTHTTDYKVYHQRFMAKIDEQHRAIAAEIKVPIPAPLQSVQNGSEKPPKG